MNGYDAVMLAERCDLSVSAKKKPVNFVWHSLKMNIFVSEVIVTELLCLELVFIRHFGYKGYELLIDCFKT